MLGDEIGQRGQWVGAGEAVLRIVQPVDAHQGAVQPGMPGVPHSFAPDAWGLPATEVAGYSKRSPPTRTTGAAEGGYPPQWVVAYCSPRLQSPGAAETPLASRTRNTMGYTRECQRA